MHQGPFPQPYTVTYPGIGFSSTLHDLSCKVKTRPKVSIDLRHCQLGLTVAKFRQTTIPLIQITGTTDEDVDVDLRLDLGLESYEIVLELLNKRQGR